MSLVFPGPKRFQEDDPSSTLVSRWYFFQIQVAEAPGVLTPMLIPVWKTAGFVFNIAPRSFAACIDASMLGISKVARLFPPVSSVHHVATDA